jgi:hypothetical protein
MAANTGRTHSKYAQFWVDNSAGTLTNLSAYVNTVGSAGLTYDTQDVTAYSDAVKNVVIGQPAGTLTVGGPIDTVVITHMQAIVGLNVPLSLDIKLGIRQAWDLEPQFGLTMGAATGYLCSSFTVDPSANTWQATFDVFGATAPAWGNAAES